MRLPTEQFVAAYFVVPHDPPAPGDGPVAAAHSRFFTCRNPRPRACHPLLANVADVHRMHALARHVAKMARRRHPDHAVPEDVNGYFAEMGRIAVDMGNDARDVVLSGDPSKAAELDDDDDSIDDLHRHLFTMLMNQDWKHSAAAAVDVTLLGRYYERFADHAVEIARRVIFQATGQQG